MLAIQLKKKHGISCWTRQTACVSPHPPLRVCFHCDVEETHVRVSCRSSQTIRVSPVTSQTCDLLCLVPPCPRLYYISYTTLPPPASSYSKSTECHLRSVTPSQHVMLTITQNYATHATRSFTSMLHSYFHPDYGSLKNTYIQYPWSKRFTCKYLC